MYKIISNKMANVFIKYKIIKVEDKEIFTYGCELLFSFVFTTIIIIILSILTRTFYKTLMYLMGFFTTRKICGGYHAKHHFSCFLLTLGTYLIFGGLSFFANKTNVSNFLNTIFCVTSFIIILSFAPIEHPNNPMTDFRKKRNRKFSIVLSVLIFVSLFSPIIFNGLLPYAHDLNIGFFLASCTIFVAKIENIILTRKEKKQ